MARTHEQTLPQEVDPCEQAYSLAIYDIYQNAGSNKSFEERVLMPVVAASQEVEAGATAKLSRAEKHRLRSEIAYDVLWRLRDAGELDAEDQITWRQTDETGEEWVEYINGAGEVFALNCPGLKYGFGNIEKNKLAKKYDKLFERSYEYENEYDTVKKLYEQTGLKRKIIELPRSRERIVRIKHSLGTIAVTGIALVSAFVATTAGANAALNSGGHEKAKTNQSHELTPTHKTAEAIPKLIEKAGPLKIRPRANFLTPEGALVDPDYVLSLPTTGATVFGYEVPQEEETFLLSGVNQSVLNTLTAAQVPQLRTTQVEAYAAAHPEYTPTWESTFKGHTSSDLQPTAMHQFSTQDDLPLSPYPGEPGGSAYFEAHNNTYGRGGGTLPALKEGDPLIIERKTDNNVYTFKFVGSETLEVNGKKGSLTQAEVRRQMERGYGAGVTFDQIARTWKGHEDEITATIQACDGSSRRVLYRFVLVDQKLTTRYTS